MFPKRKSRKCSDKLSSEIIKAAAFVPARMIAAVFLFNEIKCSYHCDYLLTFSLCCVIIRKNRGGAEDFPPEFWYYAVSAAPLTVFLFMFVFAAPVKSIF